MGMRRLLECVESRQSSMRGGEQMTEQKTCDRCGEHIRGISCSVFQDRIWDRESQKYKRLPECIAAEEEARK